MFSYFKSWKGTLPLEDSDEEFETESDDKVKAGPADRYSLDSLYEKRWELSCTRCL